MYVVDYGTIRRKGLVLCFQKIECDTIFDKMRPTGCVGNLTKM